MSHPTLALKIDIDTYRGTKRGIPRLLEILAKHRIRGSFFLSLGPDNSGKAVMRLIKRKGFLSKMLRTRAPKMYGLKTLMYGTLLPAPMIGETCADVLRSVAGEGHEVGVHAWDHVKWHDRLEHMTRESVQAEFDSAVHTFTDLMKQAPKSSAAPAWRCTADSLEVQARHRMLYHSDCRGYQPFWPLIDGEKKETLQIPTTLPTYDEIIGRNGIDDENIIPFWLSKIESDRLNSLTIHAETEGISKAALFDRFLASAEARGISVLPLEDIARHALARGTIGTSEIRKAEIPGRAGWVAVQA